MAGITGTEQHIRAPRTRRRRRRRWLIILVAVPLALILLVVVAAMVVQPRSGPPPLALPASAAPVQGGLIDGTWTAGTGSVVGFRVVQTIFGRRSDVVGRTNEVTGSVTAAQNQLTGGTFTVDLASITVNGEAQPQFIESLDTAHHPTATLTLSQPIALSSDLNGGAVATATATGQLTLLGVTRPVSFPIEGRRDGTALNAVGSINIVFADWGIRPPKNYGFLGSLAHTGVAEFLLVLRRQ
jgi:polyisoprenoid-binding protein YceI